MMSPTSPEGILLVNKPAGITSFGVVARLRRITGVKKIGHAGTLDPFATGLLIILVGKNYTRKSALFMGRDKTYKARVRLGISTDTYDIDGTLVSTSDKIPSNDEIAQALSLQQGERLQTPPMYSAKKVGGKKLYELARQGITIERAPSPIKLTTTLEEYTYPYLDLDVACSKGTYIRSIAHEIGESTGAGAHLESLERTSSGEFSLRESHNLEELEKCWQEALLK